MKRVLIHSIVFSPDGVSTAYLYNDIAHRIASEGYEVVVLTTTPHYNVLLNELASQPLTPKAGGLYYQSKFKGITVIHVPQKKFKSSLLRMACFCYWHLMSFILALFQKNISVILSPSPPLTIGVVNLLIGKIKRAKVIYNVQEIYPDLLVNQGNLRFTPIIKFLKSMERLVYNRSDAVTTIDPVFYKTIAPRFKDLSKLHIIPNFVDTEIFHPINDRLNLDPRLFPDKKDVLKLMYAGNVGHAQDWKPLVEIAKRTLNQKIEIWVIGEGVMKEDLKEEVVKNNLTNVHLIDYQPRHLMPSLIAYADLHFIFMSPEMEGEGFPSKVYTIMACAKPLLIMSGSGTPIYNFLKPIGCAELINGDNFDERCSAALDFLNEVYLDRGKLEEMGRKGEQIITDNYAKIPVTSRYVKLIEDTMR